MTDVIPYRARRDWMEVLGPAAELAKQIAGTEFVPAGIRTAPAKIAAAILYGDEIGLGPMQSLTRISVIDGRPTVAAETQRALILAAGHDLWPEESTTTSVTWAGQRRGSDQTVRVTWTLDDARKARLDGKPNWRSYPRQMLSARASAELARSLFADVIGGIAATEELSDGYAGPAAVAFDDDDEPAKPTTTRRRRRAVAAVPDIATVPEPAAVEPAVDDGLDDDLTAAERESIQPGRLPGADEGWPAHVRDLPDDTREDPGPVLMTDAQRRKMQALFREVDIQARADRLAYAARVVGRPLESSKELTVEEASRVIDKLDAARLDQVDPPADDDGGNV